MNLEQTLNPKSFVFPQQTTLFKLPKQKFLISEKKAFLWKKNTFLEGQKKLNSKILNLQAIKV